MANRDKNGRFIKGNTPWCKGGKNIKLKGHPYWGGHAPKGHPDYVSKEARKRAGIKISKSLTGKKLSEKHKDNIRKAHLGKKLSKEHVRKCLQRRAMSTLEDKFNKLIIENRLPYKFVGNGSFFIERKNPDFININGDKIAIDVYYRRHKEQFRGGLEKWKEERKAVFAKYGWQLIFFDETQVNRETVLEVCHR